MHYGSRGCLVCGRFLEFVQIDVPNCNFYVLNISFLHNVCCRPEFECNIEF
jgi:hypothetical protein